jgi:heme/copper-type cytochrome/quinol oxidase subunit 1
MHGTTMMFLFAVPIMEAWGLSRAADVGTRNIAFPRLNAFSYWVYLFGGVILWVAFLLNIGPGSRLVLLRAARRAPNSRPASAPMSGRR